MDIGKSIQFAFEDEHWLSKLGLGALISMIPFLNFAWIGYTIEIMRRVVSGHETPLPDWDDLGARWKDGLVVAIAALVYSLPGILLFLLPVGILVIPAFIQDTDAQGIIALVTTTTGLALLCLTGIYFLVFSFIFPAVQLSFSQSNTFQSCFKLRQILQWIRANAQDYLTSWLVALLAGFIVTTFVGTLGFLISWILCLGQVLLWVISVLGSAWVSAFSAHLFGQFGNKAFQQAATTLSELETIADE